MINKIKKMNLKAHLGKILVWLAFIGILFVALGVNTATRSQFDTAVANASPAQITAPVAVAPYATGPSVDYLQASSVSNSLSSAARIDDSAKNKPRLSIKTDDLPSWRWTKLDLEYSSSSGFLKDTIVGFINSLAGLGFLVASFLWSLTLGFLKYALSTNIVESLSSFVNAGYVSVAGAVWGVMVLLAIGAIATFIKGLVSGRPSQGVKSLAAFAAGIALIGIFTTGAQGQHKWSPTYANTKISSVMDTAIQSAVSSSFSLIPAKEARAGVKYTTSYGKNDLIECGTYFDALSKKYDQENRGIAGAGALKSISNLWKTTTYDSWISAQFGLPSQFGTIDNGQRVGCFLLDHNNKQEPSQAILTNTFKTPKNSRVASSWERESHEYIYQRVTGIAACSWNGKKATVNAGWKDVKKDRPITDASCQELFTTTSGATDKSGFWTSNTSPFWISYDNRDHIKTDTSAGKAASEWNNAFYGGNTSDRFIQSTLSGFTSILYFFTFSTMALGLLLMQFLLAALLIFLPLTLVLLGMRAQGGKSLLKMTGMAMASKSLFMAFIVLLIEIIKLCQVGIHALTSGSSGFFSQVLYGIAPIVGFFLLAMLVKKMGLGNIMTPRGAFDFMKSSIAQATGDSKLMSSSSASENSWGKSLRDSAQSASSMKNSAKDFFGAQGRLDRARARDDKKEAKKADKENRAEAKETLKNRRKDKLDKVKGALGAAGSAASTFANNPLESIKLAKAALVAKLKAEEAAGDTSAGRTKEKIAALEDAEAKAAAIGAAFNEDSEAAKERLEKELPFDKDKFAEDTEAASKEAMANRRELQGLTAAEMKDKVSEMQDDALDGMVANTLGDRFEGFETAAEVEAAKKIYADKMGVSPDDVIAGESGLMTVSPASASELRNLSVDELKNGVHWLDEETKARKAGESSDQYAARLSSAMVSRGLMTSSGEYVNALEVMGFDMSSASDLAAIEKWRSGGDNKVLSQTVFGSVNAAQEKAAAAAAMTWVATKAQGRSQASQERVEEAIEFIADQSSSSEKYTNELSAAEMSLEATLSAFQGEMAEINYQYKNASPEAQVTLASRERRIRASLEEKLEVQMESLSEGLESSYANASLSLLAAGDNEGYQRLQKEFEKKLESQKASLSSLVKPLVYSPNQDNIKRAQNIISSLVRENEVRAQEVARAEDIVQQKRQEIRKTQEFTVARVGSSTERMKTAKAVLDLEDINYF